MKSFEAKAAADSRGIDPARVLLPVGLGTALSLMGDATLYAVLPTHTADAGIALGSVGIILGVNRAVRLLTNGLAGLAYDRWPRRRLFLPAVFVGALSTVIYALTRGFWPLFVGRLLWGLAWSGIWIGGTMVILDVVTTRDRGRWTGLYQIWYFLGSALGSLGGGILTDWLGYTMTMWIGAALTAAGGLAALCLLPETRGVRRTPDVDRAAEVSSPHPLSIDARLPGLRADGRFWGAISLQGLNRFALSGVVSATLGLLVQRYVQDAGVAVGAASLTGVLMAGRTVFSMTAAPMVGILSDRVGDRWTILTWSAAAGTAGLTLLAWSIPIGVLAGVLTLAVSKGAIQSLVMALIGDTASQGQQGRALGMLNTVGDLGSAIGPSVAYALLPWIGLQGVYLLCAVLFAMGLILGLRFCGERRTRAPSRCVESG